MENDFLNGLSDVQRQAVSYMEGPSLVVAGAGSGKTRVLTYKIAYLINQGMKPSGILALTFTNKAAREMRSRITDLVGEEKANQLWMGTFHSIFSRILRREAEQIGFTSDYTILPSSDSKNLIRTIVKERMLDDKIYSPKTVAQRISKMKNDMVTSREYPDLKDYHDYDIEHKIPLFGELYATYCNRCRKGNMMDFDDLLLFTNILFQQHPEILVKYQNIFKYILVDEYQDTNKAQFQIVKRLAKKSHMVCVVGDDAQSIYGFRGAKIDNILGFQTDYPECRVFKLEQNYRSTPNIVNVANSLIEKNEHQIKKHSFSQRKDGSPVSLLSSYSGDEEAVKIANIFAVLKEKKDLKYSDFAILYRTNSQSRLFEDVFRRKNIPYRIWGSTSFYERAEVLNVLSYLRLIVNHDDEAAFRRVINYPARGIGATSVSKITDAANQNGVSCWQVAADPLAYGVQMNAGTLSKVASFKQLIDDFEAGIEMKDAYTFAYDVVHKTGLWADVEKDSSPEGISRLKNVEEVLNGLKEACDSKLETQGDTYNIKEFLSEVALMTSLDDNGDNDEKVTLMTVHAAKGLEFKIVAIVGMEEDLFPSSMSTGSEEGIEEERRLFYVAITRAEEFCIISYASSRTRNGSYSQTNPSRFIKDIDAALLDFSMAPDYVKKHSRVAGTHDIISKREETFRLKNPIVQPQKSYKFSVKPLNISRETVVGQQEKNEKEKKLTPLARAKDKSINSLKRQDYSSLRIGNYVLHDRFGRGEVVNLLSWGSPDARAVIKFENVGEKTLILKFANIQILS